MAVIETHLRLCAAIGDPAGEFSQRVLIMQGGVPETLYCEAGFREGRYVTQEQYQALTDQPEPFDAITGAGFFSFGLGVVVTCWLVAHAAGLVVQSVRSF